MLFNLFIYQKRGKGTDFEVPAKIENLVFWERYFYKVYQAEMLAQCKADADKQLAHSLADTHDQTEEKCAAISDQKRFF